MKLNSINSNPFFQNDVILDFLTYAYYTFFKSYCITFDTYFVFMLS